MSNSTYRNDIQGLRGVAVFMVVFYHAHIFPFLGGFVGVDIFFVVSGYLITGILAREIESTGRIDLLSFYARRVRRLLPAAILVIVSTAVASLMLLSPLEQKELVPTFLSTATYVSNFWFAWDRMDYLGTAQHENPLLHYWSLSVEEQFYVIWPALMLVGVRMSQAAELDQKLIRVSLAVLLPSLILCIWLTGKAQPWAFFASPARAWEFALGGVAYLAGARSVAKLHRFPNLTFGVGALLILASVLLFGPSTLFPGLAVIPPTVGTALILVSSQHASPKLAFVFNFPGLRTLGDLSYSWYLWHWPVQIFYMHLIGQPAFVERLLPPLISLGLAWITFRTLENPFRFNTLLSASRSKSLIAGLCLTLFAVTVGVTVRTAAEAAASSTEQVRIQSVRSELPKVYADGCHLGFMESEFGECAYGSLDSRSTIFLLGDSHAAHWFPALNEMAKSSGHKLISLTKSSCPAFLVPVEIHRLGRPYYECSAWRENVLDLVRASKPDLIFLSSYNRDWPISDRGEIDAAWVSGTERLIDELEDYTKRVVVIRDIPVPGFNLPVCLSRAAVRGQNWSVCNFPREEGKGKMVDRLFADLEARFQNLESLDMHDALCEGDSCKATVNGIISFRDAHHLTVGLSSRLSVRFIPFAHGGPR